MKVLKNKEIFGYLGLAMLSGLAMTSGSAFAAAEHDITICHYPGGMSNEPQTISIARSEWAAYRANGAIPGACGLLSESEGGCFAESFTIYGMNDDYDGVAVYRLDSAEVLELTPAIVFPLELENLTGSQSGTYYAIQANSGGSQGFYEITLTENTDGTFSGDYWKITDMAGGDYDALELIDGDFIAPHNDDNKWVKFSLDGTILAERSFADAMGNIVFPSGKGYYINKDIEDTAYDPVNKILYASHVWRTYQNSYSHLYAFDLSNGFENMVAVDLGAMYWEKVEGLLYRNGELYGASDHDNKLFKILLDANGYILGDGKGEDVPGWDSSMSSDIEGLANAFLTQDCPESEVPSVAPVFGESGRFNVHEVNEIKTTGDQGDGGAVQ